MDFVRKQSQGTYSESSHTSKTEVFPKTVNSLKPFIIFKKNPKNFRCLTGFWMDLWTYRGYLISTDHQLIIFSVMCCIVWFHVKDLFFYMMIQNSIYSVSGKCCSQIYDVPSNGSVPLLCTWSISKENRAYKGRLENFQFRFRIL